MLQYAVEETTPGAGSNFHAQVNFYLLDNVCKKEEHIVPANYYHVVAENLDRSYTCVDDWLSGAWITVFNSFIKLKLEDAFLVYTEETFE